MLSQGRTCGLAVPCNNVDHAVWYPCFLDEFAEPQSGERRLLGGLEHDRASRRQRWR
jgi:hypothetical protein